MVNHTLKNKPLDGRKSSPFSSNIEYGGRGMTLEKDIEQSNTFYLKKWHSSYS